MKHLATMALIGAGSLAAATAWAQDSGTDWPSYNRT